LPINFLAGIHVGGGSQGESGIFISRSARLRIAKILKIYKPEEKRHEELLEFAEGRTDHEPS
jgi:hypothetical protein